MSRLGPIPIAAAALGLAACTPVEDRVTGPEAPVLAAASCQLELTDAQGRALIADLIAQVDALQAAGSLTAGQANALRSHLQAALSKLDAGDYCGALVKLKTFQQQVGNFVQDGILDPEEAEGLVDGVVQITVGQLAFVTDRDGNDEVYRVNADGTGLINLSRLPLDDFHGPGGWSPDGSAIAFAGAIVGFQTQIYRAKADGSDQVNLSDDAMVSDLFPVWAPDGSEMVLARDVLGGPLEFLILRMDADGSDQVPLTTDPAFGVDMTWSPDGQRIAFASSDGVEVDIHVMNRDGSGPIPLVTEAGVDQSPTWSPDGSRILFVTNRDGNYELYAMNPDGSGQVNLTMHARSDRSPAWSPDGTKIVFERCVAPFQDCQVWVMNADGSGQTNLSNDEGFHDQNPAWSPGGRRIAFTRQDEHHDPREIFVMNADGTNKINVTDHPANDFFPSWRPVPDPAQ